MKSRAECLEKYGSDYLIQQKVKSGKLFRVGKAVYSEEGHVPELAVLAFKYRQAILTMYSAFYLHGLTDVIPERYDMATDRNAAKIRDKKVNQYFVPSPFVEQGVEIMIYKGYPIKIIQQGKNAGGIASLQNKTAF